MTIGSDRHPYRCFAKLFVTWCPRSRLLRLGRLVWARGRMMQGGYTAKVSVALTPMLFGFERGYWECAATMFGVRIHYQRSYGGVIV